MIYNEYGQCDFVAFRQNIYKEALKKELVVYSQQINCDRAELTNLYCGESDSSLICKKLAQIDEFAKLYNSVVQELNSLILKEGKL